MLVTHLCMYAQYLRHADDLLCASIWAYTPLAELVDAPLEHLLHLCDFGSVVILQDSSAVKATIEQHTGCYQPCSKGAH